MKSVVFFNNKGGVGKTTLTCNVVAYLNQDRSKRVLLIDADPQCNATQAILSEDECVEIYLKGNTARPTLFDCLADIEAGDSDIKAAALKPILSSDNKYGTDLIPGDPRMSLVEDKLSSSWGELMGGTPSGYRTTNWVEQIYLSLIHISEPTRPY